jgi:Formate/nitrite transporter
VAAGFEHSIVNVYFLTIALLIKDWAPETFWQAIDRSPADFSALTWTSAAFENLLPVTLGNMIGGSVMVAASSISAAPSREARIFRRPSPLFVCRRRIQGAHRYSCDKPHQHHPNNADDHCGKARNEMLGDKIAVTDRESSNECEIDRFP